MFTQIMASWPPLSHTNISSINHTISSISKTFILLLVNIMNDNICCHIAQPQLWPCLVTSSILSTCDGHNVFMTLNVFLFQQQCSEFNNTTTTATPVQDTTSHVISHSSYQQPWCNVSSGQILSYDLPSQLEMKTMNIMTFHDCTELFADMYQYWNTSSHGCPHAVSSSVLQVPLINPVQESCGQSDTSSSYQTALVSNEEHFVISPSSWT